MPKYSQNFKVEVLLYVEEHGLRKTEREKGVPRMTITRWAKNGKLVALVEETKIPEIVTTPETIVTIPDELPDLRKMFRNDPILRKLELLAANVHTRKVGIPEFRQLCYEILREARWI